MPFMVVPGYRRSWTLNLYVHLYKSLRNQSDPINVRTYNFTCTLRQEITVAEIDGDSDIMSEILQIFHHSPPASHHEMHPVNLQRNFESRFDWSIDSGFSSPDTFNVITDHFQCSELATSPVMNFSTSSVDELSMVTSINERDQSLKKRKFESVECDSELVGPPEAKRSIHKGNSKPKVMDSEPNFVHVRARRGQATDSHSLAERARREKIKKKMQFLQDLVPGCNNITNKAAILDEIINYVQCLQKDVEFLTLKLAASTTSEDLMMDNLFPEELSRWQ